MPTRDVQSAADATTAAADRSPVQPPGTSSPTDSSITFSQVLANRHFRNVWAAQFVSNIGTWMEAFALQMIVANLTGRLDDQGILAACQGLPIFFLGVFGGVMADRFDRRAMLIITQIIAALVAVAVGVVSLVTFESPRTYVWWLFALGAINGCVMAFNFPAWQTLTPRLVPRVQLTRAIALNGIQFNLARVVGPALAGFVLASIAAAPLFFFNAVSFLLVAWVVRTTPHAPPPAPAGVPVLRQIANAAAFIRDNKGPRAVFAAQVTISLLAAPLVRLLSLYGIDVYALSQKQAEVAVGFLLGVQGIGAVLGGLALRLVPGWYPKHHFIPVAVLSLGLSICLFALTTGLWWGYVAMLICGFFWIWSFNQSWAAMQVLAQEDMRGRVLSLTTVASFGATAVGAYITGEVGEALKELTTLGAAISTRLVVAMLGVPLVSAGLLMLAFRTPEVDSMPRVLPSGQRPTRNPFRAILASEHRPDRAAHPERSGDAIAREDPIPAETQTSRGA